jgi:apolipoprotein N-acyltransferase
MIWERLRGLGGWRADLAGFGLGALSAAALPPIHLIPVLLLCTPGLLALIDGARRPWGAIRRGFWFGMGHHVLGLYWITEAILIESTQYWWLVPLAVPGLAAILAPFIAVPCGLARLVPAGPRRVAVFAGAWVLADLARQYVGTGFPWNPWGSVWAMPGLPGDVMIQLAASIGTPGLTLLTVLMAALPALGWRWAAGSLAMLVLWAAFGWSRLHEPAPEPAGIDAVLIQGNAPQSEKWDPAAIQAAFQRQLDLTRQGVAAGQSPSVVIWPETAAGFYLLQYDPAAREAIMQAAQPAVAALVGGLTFARSPFEDRGPGNAPRNSLVALQQDGAAVAGIYDKWHLVPFGEYPPSWVPFAIQLVPGHFDFGRGPTTLHVPGLPPFGPLICYEAIFPAQVIDQIDRPDWMVNITNDAWFGNSTGPRQHLAAARLRAVEEGLPLFRAANTGISAAFDARGHELGRIELNRAGWLRLPVPGKVAATSFSRWGLVIPALLGIGLLGAGLWRRR